ncbi:F-box protein At5g07610-like [Salvia splendens]|uniref:F-box protein At5g07610-like n=1 Tax=Salvia splendens TaxID=180675 RepID=UPI001C253C40|nr:F-box protein At5g07610-like [Salvia splendens]
MKLKVKFGRTSSSSYETVASIDHLLTCILLRLPFKSLIRFKLVSKHWHSLITDPHFCRLRNPNPNPAIGLFLHFNFSISPMSQYLPFSLNQSTKPPFRTLNFTKHNPRAGILQSCNGLLLCCSFHSRPVHNRKYYIFNPTTTRFSTLPKIDYVDRNISGMNLGFDPAKSPHYKVVCVTGLSSVRYQIELYSSERGPWRECGQPFVLTAGSHFNFRKGVYWNGAIHWLNIGHGDSLYFNLENETTGSFPTPPNQLWEVRSSVYFGESCDHLHYMEMPNRQVEFDVYEMKRDYSEWFVKYKVDLRGVVASYPEMKQEKYDTEDVDVYVISFFSVIRGEKEEDSFFVFHIPGRVVRYDLACQTFRTIHVFRDAEDEVRNRCLRYRETNAIQHIQSLCCV